MAHGDAVIDRNRIEFLGDAAGGFDLARNHLAQVLQMNVTRNELSKRVDHGDDRLVEIAVFHACGAPQGAGAGHVAAVSSGAGTILRHDLHLQK